MNKLSIYQYITHWGQVVNWKKVQEKFDNFTV